MPIRIREVLVTGGTMDFADFSVQPNFAAAIEALDGSITGLSTDPNSRAEVKLDGNVGEFSPVLIAGEIQPFAYDRFTDIDAQVREHLAAGLQPVLRQVRRLQHRQGQAVHRPALPDRQPQARRAAQDPHRPARMGRGHGEQGRSDAAGEVRDLAAEGRRRRDHARHPGHRHARRPDAAHRPDRLAGRSRTSWPRPSPRRSRRSARCSRAPRTRSSSTSRPGSAALDPAAAERLGALGKSLAPKADLRLDVPIGVDADARRRGAGAGALPARAGRGDSHACCWARSAAMRRRAARLRHAAAGTQEKRCSSRSTRNCPAPRRSCPSAADTRGRPVAQGSARRRQQQARLAWLEQESRKRATALPGDLDQLAQQRARCGAGRRAQRHRHAAGARVPGARRQGHRPTRSRCVSSWRSSSASVPLLQAHQAFLRGAGDQPALRSKMRPKARPRAPLLLGLISA